MTTSCKCTHNTTIFAYLCKGRYEVAVRNTISLSAFCNPQIAINNLYILAVNNNLEHSRFYLLITAAGSAKHCRLFSFITNHIGSAVLHCLPLCPAHTDTHTQIECDRCSNSAHLAMALAMRAKIAPL